MQHHLRRMFGAGILAVVLLGACPRGGAAQAPPVVAFDIPAQPLSVAVLRFSEEARVQLVFGAPLANGVRANAVEGSYSIADALDRLLAGTGLTWRYLNAYTVTIEPKATSTATATTTIN